MSKDYFDRKETKKIEQKETKETKQEGPGVGFARRHLTRIRVRA